jgi:ABC-2 family transporter protein
MIRFSWLQARAQTFVAAGVLVIIGLVLAITGPHLVHLYNAAAASCGTPGNCGFNLFPNLDNTLRIWLSALVIVVPGLIAIFWGAPLVARESETGTFRLAWTQSITRTHWLVAKLGLLGVISMAVTGLLSLFVTWWASPMDAVQQNRYAFFDARGIVPLGYAAFAFALGVLFGVVFRRTLPAMALTLVVLVVAQLAFLHEVRPHLYSPTRTITALSASSIDGLRQSPGGNVMLMISSPSIPNAWIYSNHIVDSAGRPMTSQRLLTACPGIPQGPTPPPAAANGSPLRGTQSRSAAPQDIKSTLEACAATVARTFHQEATYQPASRYWAFQWYELGIYLAAALLLAGASIGLVRRGRF